MLNLNMGNNPQRQDSNNIQCDHSDRINEDFIMLSEAFQYEGQEETPLNKLAASSDHRPQKGAFSTESYVRRYSELSHVLENRKNPLVQDKGKISHRIFQDQVRSPNKRRCACKYPKTCALCEGEYVSRKDRPMRYESKKGYDGKRHYRDEGE